MNIEIPAPMDAEGNEIDIESCEVLYDEDGEALEINFWQWNFGNDDLAWGDGEWTLNALMEGDTKVRTYYPRGCYVDRPDSLKRLVEDLEEVISKTHISADGIISYVKKNGVSRYNTSAVLHDIVKRVIALTEKEKEKRECL